MFYQFHLDYLHLEADYLNIKQDTLAKIMAITLPVYVISFILTKVDFNILWRYFNWANQVTAVLALLVTTRYLFLKSKNYWVTFIPGIFMLYACVVYIFSEPIGLGLGLGVISYIGGLIVTGILVAVYWYQGVHQKESLDPQAKLLHDEWPILTRDPDLAK